MLKKKTQVYHFADSTCDENVEVSMSLYKFMFYVHLANLITITLRTFIHVFDPRGESSVKKERLKNNEVCLELRMDLQKNNAKHLINDEVLQFLF